MSAALVFLHGFTGAPASFDELCACVRTQSVVQIHRPLLLGHGARAEGVQSFDAELDRLASELSGAGAVGAHLCAYSMGARLGLGLLARHRNLFRGATLIGLQAGPVSEQARADRRAADAEWCRVLEEEGLPEFVRRWELQPTFASQARAGERLARALAAQRQLRLSQRPAELARALRVLGVAEMPDYSRALAELVVPVTLVAGELDMKFVELARALLEDTSSLGLEIVRGVGHNVVLEAPQALAGILTKAISR